MNKKEKELLRKMIALASIELGNNGCNDVDVSFYDGWTKEERQTFVKEFHDWNGDPEEYDEKFLHLADFSILDFLSHKLKNENIQPIKTITLAEKMRIISNNNSNGITIGQILDKIKIEAESGPTELYLDNFNINDTMKKELEKEGFTVEVGGRYNETNTLIKW